MSRRTRVHRDDQQPSPAAHRRQRMSAHPPECVPRAAQHGQHPDWPRRPHRRPGLRAVPGEVFFSSRTKLL